jgi:hypothetical protein
MQNIGFEYYLTWQEVRTLLTLQSLRTAELLLRLLGLESYLPPSGERNRLITYTVEHPRSFIKIDVLRENKAIDDRTPQAVVFIFA